jgi:hypothetical protein
MNILILKKVACSGKPDVDTVITTQAVSGDIPVARSSWGVAKPI